MGWLIALGIIVLLAVLPLGVSAKYDELGPQLWVIAGPLRLKLLPGKKKEKDKKKKKAPKIKTKERPQEILEKDIYTLDGFAKIEDATFEFVKDEEETKVIGEGNVKFQDIPTKYYINDILKKPKIAFAPEDAVEGVEFTIDSKGNLNAAFEDDAEVELNLKGIKKKEFI